MWVSVKCAFVCGRHENQKHRVCALNLVNALSLALGHMHGTLFQLTLHLRPVHILSSDCLRLASSIKHFPLNLLSYACAHFCKGHINILITFTFYRNALKLACQIQIPLSVSQAAKVTWTKRFRYWDEPIINNHGIAECELRGSEYVNSRSDRQHNLHSHLVRVDPRNRHGCDCLICFQSIGILTLNWNSQAMIQNSKPESIAKSTGHNWHVTNQMKNQQICSYSQTAPMKYISWTALRYKRYSQW
jgi:hypothetical protein